MAAVTICSDFGAQNMLYYFYMEKEMATHSSTLAWKIPWMEEPGRLQSMESQSRTRLSDFNSLTSYFITGEGNGNTLQCSCLESLRDRGAWWAMVHGIAGSRTRLKWLSIHCLYKIFIQFFIVNHFFPTSGIWLHRKWGEREYNWTLCYI